MKPSHTPVPPLPATAPQKLRLPLRPAIATVFLLICLVSPLQAAITWTGEIDPTDPTTWTYGISVGIGQSSTGTITVDGASTLNTGEAILGYNFGSSGTVTIIGAGSTWNNSRFTVGESGTGTLNIEEGGQVINARGYLGYNSGSSGTATVTGAGSKWTTLGLIVGTSGSGTLHIDAGGLISITRDGSCVLGDNSGSFGTASVSGIGSSLTYHYLYIGYSGTGALNIQAGGQVIGDPEDINRPDTCSFIGYNSGSAGTVTVTGAGSKWTPNSDFLSVGYNGSGILKIEAGGQVSNNYCYVGDRPGSTGSATVTGNGSIWTNSRSLCVGYYGGGSLNIEEGGLVSCSSCGIGVNRDSMGSVSVAGAGSRLISSGGLVIGYSGNGTLNIGNGIASGELVTARVLDLTYESTGTAICNLNGGTLQTNMIAKGTGTASFNWNDGTIRHSDQGLTIDGTHNLLLKLAATGTHAFYIDAGRMGRVFAILSDATSDGTLAKQGDGLLVLSAANTYSGTTTIEGGQLKLIAGGDIALSSEIINRAGFIIDGGNHSVQKITGSGATQVLTGSLTASSIVQDTLTIGGTTNAVPEPSTIVLLALSALALFGWSRKR